MLAKINYKTLLLVISFLFLCAIVHDVILATTGERPQPAHGSDLGQLRSNRTSIAKVSMLYGERNPLYERALAAHETHNDRFGYEMHILREQTLPGYWSKPAYILNLLLQELSRPKEDRLEWLVWFDGDVVLMNPKIPLEVFLPSDARWNHINAIVTNDHRGLNNGVFFLRVHEWSVWLMTACLGTEIFVPGTELEFGDQTALGLWLYTVRFRNGTMHVPQRWFNAYAGDRGDPEKGFADPLSPSTKFKANSIKEGDLLVHHAGHKSLRPKRMLPWLEVAEQHLPEWELELENTTYSDELSSFWEKEAPKERQRVDGYIQKDQKDGKVLLDGTKVG